ncbi:MAG TPA: hypothetical protein VGY55_11900 [Pirellulales bacterium]|jgi:hypothetical protein|nr:hypothetical protein [Pirellulales bacterium]
MQFCLNRRLLLVGAVLLAALVFAPGQALAQRGRLFEQRAKLQELQEKQQEEEKERNQPPRANPAERAVAAWLDQLGTIVPREAAGFSAENVDDFRKATDALERWSAELVRFDNSPRPNEMLPACDALLNAKDRVDRQLNQTLALRTGFAALDGDARHAAINNYLATTSGLIDLSGRLRYMLFDALTFTADEIADVPGVTDQLLDALLRRRSAIGAAVAVDLLFDPPADESEKDKIPPASASTKRKVLELIAATGQMDLLKHVARFARDPKTPPVLLLTAAETIRQIGLPQDLRPGQDPEVPPPAITAKELYGLLARIPAPQWPRQERSRVAELTTWLSERMRVGLTEDRLRMGSFDVQPGDWLLMRNPSPYNLFTDFSPGLFTHVGVVAMEKGRDGIRRMVLVDLPERGTNMPATNVDAFVDRSLHYVFLRHPDPAVARKMGETAASLIACPTEFDLNFQTDRVTALKGQPLAGKKIHTYCAGFLLLCCQDTGRPREEFFPIPEAPGGGNTRENLAKLGITFGDSFISPTGALFSSKLQIVGRREPMYDPQREVEEAIYDHFADGLKAKQLNASSDLFQTVRLKLAEASKTNPLLANAMASAAKVDKDLDLVSAAKAAAVVETLDEIAYGNSGDYIKARRAIMAGATPPPEAVQDPADRTKFDELRARHARLAELWDKQQLSPRALRLELVNYYITRGKNQLDSRFFGGEKALTK